MQSHPLTNVLDFREAHQNNQSFLITGLITQLLGAKNRVITPSETEDSWGVTQ